MRQGRRPLRIPAASACYAGLRLLMRTRVLRFEALAFPRGKATRKRFFRGTVVRYSMGLRVSRYRREDGGQIPTHPCLTREAWR